MGNNGLTLLAAALLTSSILGCAALKQPVELPPPAPVATIWQKLGVPQGLKAIQVSKDNLINRRGNFPGLERKPPIKALADPANLESENSAIAAAAKIKQEEDQAPQKIKAIKFLASVGCGCYDKDGEVEKAFLEALEDCTLDVRKAALEAIQETLSSCRCGNCCGTCCTPKIQRRLADMARGMEPDGCYIEPSAELRRMAHQILCACPEAAEEVEQLITPDPEPVIVPHGSGGGSGTSSVEPPPNFKNEELPKKGNPELPKSRNKELPNSNDNSDIELNGAGNEKDASIDSLEQEIKKQLDTAPNVPAEVKVPSTQPFYTRYANENESVNAAGHQIPTRIQPLTRAPVPEPAIRRLSHQSHWQPERPPVQQGPTAAQQVRSSQPQTAPVARESQENTPRQSRLPSVVSKPNNKFPARAIAWLKNRPAPKATLKPQTQPQPAQVVHNKPGSNVAASSVAPKRVVGAIEVIDRKTNSALVSLNPRHAQLIKGSTVILTINKNGRGKRDYSFVVVQSKPGLVALKGATGVVNMLSAGADVAIQQR